MATWLNSSVNVALLLAAALLLLCLVFVTAGSRPLTPSLPAALGEAALRVFAWTKGRSMAGLGCLVKLHGKLGLVIGRRV